MKFYTDLEGKIEAQPGDLVALAVSEYGGMLHQPELSKRPRLSADGKSAVFDWKEGEGGPIMVTLESTDTTPKQLGCTPAVSKG